MRSRALLAVPLLLILAPADAAAPVASASDAVTAYFSVLPAASSRLVLVAPSGAQMVVEYAPPLLVPLEPAVARVTFDGQVAARGVQDPTRVIPASSFTVTGSLVGERADGTWTLVQPVERYPTGLQLAVAGKTWDDVMPALSDPSDAETLVFAGTASEPIEGDGTGRFAADLSTSVKAWNWHAQAAPRYDVGLLAPRNLQNPEQDPRLAAYG